MSQIITDSGRSQKNPEHVKNRGRNGNLGGFQAPRILMMLEMFKSLLWTEVSVFDKKTAATVGRGGGGVIIWGCLRTWKINLKLSPPLKVLKYKMKVFPGELLCCDL